MSHSFVPVPGGALDFLERSFEMEPETTQETTPRTPNAVKVQATGQVFSAAARGTYSTVVVNTATNVYQQILPVDPNRTEAQVLAVDNPVVLCQNETMAQSAANQVSGTPFPVGSYLPANYDRPILNGDELWVVATTNTNSRVSVIVNYKE